MPESCAWMGMRPKRQNRDTTLARRCDRCRRGQGGSGHRHGSGWFTGDALDAVAAAFGRLLLRCPAESATAEEGSKKTGRAVHPTNDRLCQAACTRPSPLPKGEGVFAALPPYQFIMPTQAWDMAPRRIPWAGNRASLEKDPLRLDRSAVEMLAALRCVEQQRAVGRYSCAATGYRAVAMSERQLLAALRT